MFGFRNSTPKTKPPLKCIIVGCGKVGQALVDVLCSEGNDITLVDQDASVVEEMTGLYDIMGIVGNGASFQVQQDAGIHKADLLIAVTESDELNLLCCTVAKQVWNCATIARVRTPDYSAESNFLRDRLGLAMIINPEQSAAMEIAHLLSMPGALEVTPFAHGQARLIRVKLSAGSPIIGMTVAEYNQQYKDPMLFCAIERNNIVHIANGDFLFRENDIVAFVCSFAQSKICLSHIGIESGAVKNCLIVGGGKCSFYLSKLLLADHIAVKIIEQNRARCEFLSEELSDAIIIHGDGTDESLLHEEELSSTEAFVPLTGIDEENIILTLNAKQVSTAKVVTKIDRFSFKSVLRSLDLGSVVYPRYLTAEAIIAYARARRASLESNKIETLTQLYEQQVECIEFNIDESSASITGKPIRTLHLKPDLMIPLISRHGKVLFPLGSDTIEVGDSVMVVTTHKGFSDILDILA
ncbi:MAG: Trk system potassium transporter TrkA [Lachnospiraceae bacterium]|nr:Trk system potassium transporter TrkA [Lachnospiraceae bacterium]